MKRLPTKLLITCGLVGLLVSLLLIAVLLGLIPDRRAAIRQGRAALAEAVASSSSELITLDEIDRLKANLQLIVDRNDDLLSAAVRRSDGHIPLMVGHHKRYWRRISGKYSTDSQVQIPIYQHAHKWGQVELRFAPVSDSNWFGFAPQPWMRLVVFIACGSFVAFYVYIGRMLKHLDPSRAIPPRVKSALDTMAEGLLVVDAHEQIVLANSAFGMIVGKSPHELIGHDASRFPWETADGAPMGKDDSPWRTAMTSGEAQRSTMMRLKDPNGIHRSFNVNCSPVLGGDGASGGVLISFDDVTQLEQKQAELNEAKEAAESANRSKSEFLAKMSHEIRTPMNAILGFAEVLRRGYSKSEEESRKHLNTIHASGTHLLEIINDILDLSKVESGRLEVERVSFTPHQAVLDVLQVLRVKAEEKAITLEAKAEGPIPATIVSDSARLRQIVTNLVGNAIKFTDKGGVQVVLRLVREDAPKLAIDVIDTGIGMPKSQLENIFDPFSQADSSVTRRYGGTGLGLTISRQFAQALGGDITVTSEPKKGSKFTVTLETGPLDGVEMLSPEQLWHEQSLATENAHQMRLKPARVLVVDDGEENRELITVVLSEAGLTVEGAQNGQEGVTQALAGSFDIILMDMQMPVMDGYTATKTLRDRGVDIPIFALTADAMKGFEKKCLAAGCSGYLTKPVDIDRLLETLGELVGVQKVEMRPSSGVSQEKPIQSSDAPIVSRLPANNPRFRRVIIKFVARFDEQFAEIESATADRDYSRLAKLAHWLKGSGGTVGFNDFTAPAMRLEKMAKAESLAEVQTVLAELRDLRSRIQVPDDADSADEGQGGMTVQPPIEHEHETLRLDERSFDEVIRSETIIEEFSRRLQAELEDMARASTERNSKALAQFAHWLKGSVNGLGYEELMAPASQLERLSLEGDFEEIDTVLADLHDLAANIQRQAAQSPNQESLARSDTTALT